MGSGLGARPVINIEQNQNFVWDTGLLVWVAETQPGGGGGGATTIADGADTAEGFTTDAAVVTDVGGTVSGKLRGLVKIFASVWDSVNGRLKVDGSGVTQPVSGTVTANQGGSPWGQNLTQLAGTAVDVNSGNKSAGTLRIVIATDQPQLTNALKVDGSAVNQPIVLDTPTGITHGKTTVTTAGTRVALASSTAVKSVTIKALVTNTGTIYVGGNTVSSSNGFQLAAGEAVSMDLSNLNTINIDSSVNGEGVTYVAVS